MAIEKPMPSLERAPQWTSAEQPVVCWPVARDVLPVRSFDHHYHSHPDFEASIVLEGEQEVLYADARIRCAPGDVWLAAPGEAHGYRTPGMTNICLAFGPDFLGDTVLGTQHWLWLFALSPGKRPRAQSARQRANLLNTGWQLYEEATSRGVGWEAAIRVHLPQLLLTLVRGCPTAPRAEAAAGHLGALLPALQLVCVRSKAGEPVSTTEAAQACALSRSHFCRVFRGAIGRSFGQFELQSRLGVAARLLQDSAAPVNDIAVRTGFWDSSHLSRHFVAQFQVSPRVFRARSHSRSRREGDVPSPA